MIGTGEATMLSLQPCTRSRVHLRPMRFADYEPIARLERTVRSGPPSFETWRMLWQGSPLWPKLAATWPIGWVLETATGEIVGSIDNIPLRYHFRGTDLIAASGKGWVVAPEYRGFALWLLDERFNQQNVDLFMDTTIGANSIEAFDALSTRIPAGDWGRVACRIIDHRAVAQKALRRLRVPGAPILAAPAGAALRLKEAIFCKRLPRNHASFVVETTDRFDSRFDVLWNELLRGKGDILLAARDAATLNWHFSTTMRNRRLWIFTASRNCQLRAYCIFKAQGSTQALLPRMRLIDYQTIEPEADLLPDILHAALRRCAAEGICVLDKPGVGVQRMRLFDEFAAYRQKQCWSSFYRTPDADLARALQAPRVWDPSEYDGDASIE